MHEKPLRAISLFSNCGAGDVGYAKAGFRFDVMAELEPRRLEICLLNHPNALGVSGDLRDTWPVVVDEYREIAGSDMLTLLAACPPCQGMSSARSFRGNGCDPDAGMRDPRNLLVTVISKVARETRPRVIVVENVQAFLTRKIRDPRTHLPVSAARWLIDALASDYTVFPFLTDLCDYGVPQSRKRTFLTFFRHGEDAILTLATLSACPYPIPCHASDYGGEPVRLRDALASFNLPPLDARSPKSAGSCVGRGLHRVPVWSEERYRMVAAIPKHSGRSAWQNDRCSNCGPVSSSENDAVCPECKGPLLRPVVRLQDGNYRLVNGFRSSTYARMKSNAPASTITTASGHIGSNNTIHPFENRLLSPLECALLQTLPRNFKWGDAVEKWGVTNVRAMIGEAVPPLFTNLHGSIIRKLLEGKKRLRAYPVSGKRSKRTYAALGLPKPA